MAARSTEFIMKKMDVTETDTPVPEVKSKRYSTEKICCVFSVCLLIAIVVAGLGFGIYQAVVHLKSSGKSDQILQRSPISIQLQTSVSISADIVPTSAISPSPTVLAMTSSVNVNENTIGVSSWSRWLPWTSCSTSCGGGVQTRTRICGNPKGLLNEQPTCSGQPLQTRNCSEWKCPDCSKVCAVGKLNAGCDACICTNNTFSGKVLNEGGVPLDNVTIALAEFPFNILATTTSAGFFEVQGICVSNEDILLKRPSYTPKTVKAIPTSPTVASVKVTLAAIVYPEVTVHPESKLRFEGDNVTFCCKANAKPDPLYEWIISGLSGDKYQYDVSSGSQVIIPQLNKNMSGEVKCRAYNDYGAEFSNVATLKVLDRVVDTCNSTPAQRLSSLPSGCIHVETNSTTVDLGECSNEKCIGQYLGRTSTCVDKNYCCQSKTGKQIRIKCASALYINLTQITSCGCGECSTPVSTVSGVAKGGKDNTPFVYGFIFSANGKRLARTRADGSFSFTVPPGTTRLVITFKDLSNYNNNFYDLTKVVPFAIGSETFVNVRMRQRPPPITVNATEGFQIPLGGNGTGNENLPAAAISMPPKSLITADGKIYNGSVKATVDFVDPRNGSEVEEADGDFSATSEDGEQQLLETFGVMRMDFKDDKGSKLEPSTDIDVLLDLDKFNLTAEGAAAIKLWFMDEKTGRWRLMDTGLKEDRQRRSKRSKRLFFFGKIDRDKYYHSVNLDVIADLCAINVRTTEDGAVLTVLVKTSSRTNQYTVHTLKSGDQCIGTLCTENGATLQVTFKGDNLFPNDTNLVTRFQEEHGVTFHANKTSAGRFTNRITMRRIPRELDPPFYPNIARCNAKTSGSNLAFVFEKIGSNQQFENVLEVPKEVRDTKFGKGYEYWYTKPEGDLCFFKISVENVKVCNDKNEKPYFHVESFVEYDRQSREVGYTLLSPEGQDKSVCAEFRCPRNDSDKVTVKLTSLTPRVRLYEHNTQFCSRVSSVSQSSINGHIFEFSPEYSVTQHAAGIAQAFGQNMERDMYAVNKPYINRICPSMSPAMKFKCHGNLQK